MAKKPLKAKISTDTSKQKKLVVNGMEFVSIQDEKYRTYSFPFGGNTYTINNPQWLFVRPSGAHLVIDGEKKTHYIPGLFIGLVWDNQGDIKANF